MPALQLSGVRKGFAGRPVLAGVSAALHAGKPTLLLGANGAGKTTLLRILAGLSRADGGDISYDGTPWRPLGGRCGYVGHALMLYGALTLAENLRLYAELLGVSDLKPHVERWELDREMGREVRLLSKGLQYRASLCRCYLGDPAVVLLDEPSSSLDEKSFALLQRELSSGAPRLTLVATHDIHRIAPLAGRVLVLHEGAVRADSAAESAGSDAERMDRVLGSYRSWNR